MDWAAVVALVDAHHITDRRLLRARRELERRPGERSERAFRREAVRYFSQLIREARAQVAEVDRRLDDVYQQQYNLTAERAVAARRLEEAQSVLRALNGDE
jgi:hypothetical protein